MAGKSVKEGLMRRGVMLREDLRARERERGREGRTAVRGGRQKEFVVLVGGRARRKK
jgi:hypothetical protein